MAAVRCVASTSRASLVDAAARPTIACSCRSASPSVPSSRTLSTALARSPRRPRMDGSPISVRRSLSTTSRLGATVAQADVGRGDAMPPSMLDGQAGAAVASQLAQNVVLPTSMLGEPDLKRLKRMRNIGISAHVDSGKTTLTERVLFYTGRIKAIHEVRGKDEVGAKMDSMELEREKGITIQSAATFCDWQIRAASNDDAVGAYKINIIDTPGHVDFTIEVERALRVLDGAVLVLCAVSGVQSQSITVDRQMRRYNVPRISFINKMDRAGANPYRVVDQIRSKLKIPAALIQLPIGAEDAFEGVVDLVRMVAVRNQGEKGIDVVETAEMPAALLEAAKAKRAELIETLADVDDDLAELFLDEQPISNVQLQDAIRRATIARRFSPVVVGTALGNTSIQPLLDAVCTYLPAPNEVAPSSLGALDVAQSGHPAVQLVPAVKAPFVGLAFKLEEGKFGQLTYVRVYQGTLGRGAFLVNVRTGKRVKVPKLVRMHSNEMEEVQSVGAGEICAVYGIDCASGDTFTDGASVSMTPMFVPAPVISLSIRPKGQETPAFSRAINRFQREDPTFHVHVDNESGETIISGMGELHLEIYVERMRREYGIECVTGKPQVAFRETITRPATFAYTHKKQSGGAGQFARVVGRIEPVTEPDEETGLDTDFQNELIGTAISESFFPAIKKGFEDSLKRGALTNHPVTGVRFVLEDGAMHAVDSSELAFRTAAQGAFREAFGNAGPVVLEPIMRVECTSGPEFQGQVVSLVNQRRGIIVESEIGVSDFTLLADVGLSDMFGFSSSLRAATAGKAEFTMEFIRYAPVNPGVQKEMVDAARRFSAPKA